MAEADFEHLDEENEEGDAQALGAAGAEQAQHLDQSRAIQDDDVSIEDDTAMQMFRSKLNRMQRRND